MSFVRSQKRSFPTHWEIVAFDDAFEVMTAGNTKILTRDYMPNGVLPVIDQGQTAIAGYVDDTALACKAPLPCILFGDHTRIFKYVNQPFALGADGVQVLVPRPGLDTRFAFNYLQTVRLPHDLGYSRHFKYLREARVPRPPLSEQKRIAAILDKADAIRRKRQQTIELTENLVRSAFLEMFGDPVTNPKGWDMKKLGGLLTEKPRNGVSPSSSGTFPGRVLSLSAITSGVFLKQHQKKAHFDVVVPVSKQVSAKDMLICRGNGNLNLVGRGCFPSADEPDLAFPDTAIAVRPSSELGPEYLASVWVTPWVRNQLEAGARTTNGTYKINQQLLQNVILPVPPRAEQDRFAAVYRGVDRLRGRLLSGKESMLAATLTQRAFSGTL